jgi:hypothetical protein
MKNAHRIFAGKSDRKKLLGPHIYYWEDGIKMYLKEQDKMTPI